MKKLIALALTALLLFCCCSCDLLKEPAFNSSQDSNAPQSAITSAEEFSDESATDASADTDESKAASQAGSKTEISAEGSITDESVPDVSAAESEAASQAGSKTETSAEESITDESAPNVSAAESEAVSSAEESAAAVILGVTAKYNGNTLFVGNSIAKSDIAVTASYSDGSLKDITSFTISPTTVAAAGNNTVTVTYSGKTATVTVPGKAVMLTGISAKYNGNTLFVGDGIARSDIAVTASYSDGSSKDITSFTISPTTVAAAGNNTVIVTYSGKTATVTVPGKAGAQANVEDTAVISIGSKQIWMTMTAAELTAVYGQPDEELASFKSYTWYVYGTDDYTDFFAAAVDENGTVVALYANSPRFSYKGVGFGDVCPIPTDDVLSEDKSNKGVRSKAYTTLGGYTVTYYVDHNNQDSDGNALVHAVCIEKTLYIEDIDRYSYTQPELDDGCKLNFHFLNAFRLCYGLNILEWCDKAADVAEGHSLDMATQNYVSHESLDGRKTSDRITNGEISWQRCGENIAAGSDTALFTHNGWVNSPGHRGNLIGEFERIGIGASYNKSAKYRIYWTQNFYTPR